MIRLQFKIKKHIHNSFFSFWLISFSITGSQFIHLRRADSNVSLLWLGNIPLFHYYVIILHIILHMYHNFFIPLSADGQLACFYWYSCYGEYYGNFLKKNSNKTIIWLRNPTTGPIPWENHNRERHMYANIHCHNDFICSWIPPLSHYLDCFNLKWYKMLLYKYYQIYF